MKDKPKVKDIILYGIIVFLCIQSLFLAVVNRNVSREKEKLHFLLYTPTGTIPQEQKTLMLPAIRLKNIKTGETQGIFDAVDRETLLLFVFSTHCFSCEKAAEILNEVYREFNDEITIRGISKDDSPAIEEYVMNNNIQFPVFRCRDTLELDIFTALPQTFLVKNGKIVFTLNGIPLDLKRKIQEAK